MYDFGESFHMDITKSRTTDAYIYAGKKYRISILSEVLIRFEYSENGTFNDYPTMFASNRSFSKPKITFREDQNVILLNNDIFTIQYIKEKPFVGSRFAPEQNLKVTINNTDKIWYFNHPEVRNFKGTFYSLDGVKNDPPMDKGLFSLDGFVSIDDSRTPILTENGNIIAPNYKNIDTYLFVYNKDFGLALRDYFNLTGHAPLIPRYLLGNWWYKNEAYNVNDLQKIVTHFKKNNIPLSVLLLGEYERTKNKDSNLSFSLNKIGIPSTENLSNFLHSNNIYLGCNTKTDGNLSQNEEKFPLFSQMYGINKTLPINVYDEKFMVSFLNTIINSMFNSGIDFLWIDDDNKKNALRDFVMNYYIFNYMGLNKQKRNIIMSRNFGYLPHKFGILYSGKTNVSWKTLRSLPFYNANASNIGVSWWSHDIGGFENGTEDSELYMRWVQFGTYSPILRLSSNFGKYYKREPWKWDARTFKVVHDYLRLRHRLIPYLYSEAYKYSSVGSPLIQPLYYKYPETYDEKLYRNEYYFGTELFVCPIVDPKDNVMDRVVHQVFLPNGVWYDFKTGKKFPGAHRYVTFYKDEDYPVYARTGAIIPMMILDENNLNNTKNPENLEVHIFPGRSNTYKLYEDDGITDMYKEGYSNITEINYYYKENDFSVSIEPKDGGNLSVLPKLRNYIIRFRNTKYTKDVQVFADEMSIPFESYVDDTDFIVKFDNVKTSSKIYVHCKGSNIEIDAERVINEDLESIISDLRITTELKIEIDKIIFSKKSIKEKRIAIRRLKRKGLDDVFVKMFLKLLEYVAEI